MQLQEARNILEPYGIIILHDKDLKLYKMYFSAVVVYVPESDFETYAAPEFKVAVAQALLKEAASGHTVTVH